jgi:membrane protease YdiL (CAAX protease family)
MAIAAAAAAGGDALVNGVAALREHLGSLDPAVLLGEHLLSRTTVWFVGGVFYLAILLAVLTMARLRGGRHWRELVGWRAFTPDRMFWGLVAAGLVWGVASSAAVEFIYPQAKNWVVLPNGLPAMAASFVTIVVLGPLAEELIFRGWIYTSLTARFGGAASIGVTGLLFALAHWEKTHLYAAAVFPLGLLLGYTRRRSESVLASTTFHGIYNGAFWVLTMLGVS